MLKNAQLATCWVPSAEEAGADPDGAASDTGLNYGQMFSLLYAKRGFERLVIEARPFKPYNGQKQLRLTISWFTSFG